MTSRYVLLLWLQGLCLAGLFAASLDEANPTAAAAGPDLGLPYVSTRWSHLTTEDGLPNDHIFAIKVDGPRVWIGTENGLALIDKPTARVVRTWQEKDGLPFRVVTAIDV